MAIFFPRESVKSIFNDKASVNWKLVSAPPPACQYLYRIIWSLLYYYHLIISVSLIFYLCLNNGVVILSLVCNSSPLIKHDTMKMSVLPLF